MTSSQSRRENSNGHETMADKERTMSRSWEESAVMDVNTETMMNMALLDPPKYGWSAAGGIVDVLPPVESARRRSTREAFLLTIPPRERERPRKGGKRDWGAKMAPLGPPPSISAPAGPLLNGPQTAVAAAVPGPIVASRMMRAESEKKLAPVQTRIMKPAPDSKDTSLAVASYGRIPSATVETENLAAAAAAAAAQALASTFDPSVAAKPAPSVEASQTAAIAAITAPPPEKAAAKPRANEKKKKGRHVYRVKALNEEETSVDMYTYHRGREGFEPRDASSGDLLCDVGPSDSTFGWEQKRLKASITVCFPIGDGSDTIYEESKESQSSPSLSEKADNAKPPAVPTPLRFRDTSTEAIQYFRETIEWDLADPKTPTAMAFATSVAEEYGLNFGQTMDLAMSIQRQVDQFQSSLETYTAPITLKDPNTGKPRGKTSTKGTPFQLYGAPVATTKSGLPLPPKRRPTRSESRGQNAGGVSARDLAILLEDNPVEKEDVIVSFKSEPEYRNEAQRRLRNESVAKCLESSGRLDIKRNGPCHSCHLAAVKNGPSALFACGVGHHGLCERHLKSHLGLTLAGPEPITLDYCPMCSLACECNQCLRRLDRVATELKRRSISQGTKLSETNFDDIFSFSTTVSQNKSRRASPKSAVLKRRPEPVEQAPIGDFPTEFNRGICLEPATSEDYRTVFTEEGAFPVGQSLAEKIEAAKPPPPKEASTEQPQPKPEMPKAAPGEVVEDGNVDYCQVCRNAGNLFCCDRCPRAFHKKCIEPVEPPSEGDWECHVCKKEKEGSDEDDHVTGKGFEQKGKTSMDKICASLVELGYCEGLRETTLILAMIHEMLNTLIEYEFGFIFAEPVNLKQVPQYKSVVREPMDLGTILSKLEAGEYAKLYKERNSWDAVLIAVLRDIELVWHNCFTFNFEGSAIYRMAEVHRRKYLNIRKRSFDSDLSAYVKEKVEAFVTRCASERSSNANSPNTKSSRYRITVPCTVGKKGRPVAVLDPETGMLARAYTTVRAACQACKFLLELNHKSEYTPLSENMIKNVIKKGASDASLRLFGFRWMFLDELRAGSASFNYAAEEDGEGAGDAPPTVFVEVTAPDLSFTFPSIEEALCFFLLPRDSPIETIREFLHDSPMNEWKSIAGFRWRKTTPASDSAAADGSTVGECAGPGNKHKTLSFPPHVAVVKIDKISGRQLLGFETDEAACKDWAFTCSCSPACPKSRDMDVEFFRTTFLDQDSSVDGIIWKTVDRDPLRVQPLSAALGVSAEQEARSEMHPVPIDGELANKASGSGMNGHGLRPNSAVQNAVVEHDSMEEPTEKQVDTNDCPVEKILPVNGSTGENGGLKRPLAAIEGDGIDTHPASKKTAINA